jgi:hypothetical protein
LRKYKNEGGPGLKAFRSEAGNALAGHESSLPQGDLPPGFSPRIAEAILTGLGRAAVALEAMPP